MYLSLIFVDWLRTWMWGTPCLLSWVLGYSRKIPKKGWVEYIYTFLKKPLWIYIFVTLSLENKLSPLEIPKNLRPMERPMENPYNFFLITPRKSTSFLIDSGISTCFFPCPHPCHLFGLDLFWNSQVLLVCIHIALGSHLM